MPSSSTSLHRILGTKANFYAPSEPDETEEPGSPTSHMSNRETDYSFEPDDLDDDVETNFSPAKERSQIETTYNFINGRRSSIKEMKFFDARDVKNRNWKVVLPFEKNKCHRAAAAASILCNETADKDGNPLPSDIATQYCELLLKDMSKKQALGGMSVLYTTYRKQGKSDGYIPFARRELRRWYDNRPAKGSVRNQRNINDFQGGQPKRPLDSTTNLPPPKRTPHWPIQSIAPKPVVAEAIQVQSSPQVSPSTPFPHQSSTRPAARIESISVTPTNSAIGTLASDSSSIQIASVGTTPSPTKALGKCP